jgi:hypothetical protein
MPKYKRIRTVLYGDQRVSAGELEILHTPAMQRLYGLRQLGLTDRVFIDASHSRIHHVLGVLAQVDKLVNAIVGNLRRTRRDFSFGTTGKSASIGSVELAADVADRHPVIRLIGLLHDLTHAPFGHTVEDEIKVVDSRHDQPDRQAEAFFRLVCQVTGWLASDAGALDSESPIKLPDEMLPVVYGAADINNATPEAAARLVSLISGLLTTLPAKTAKASWRLSQSDLAVLLAQMDSAMTALLHLEVLHAKDPKPEDIPRATEYPFQVAIRKGLGSSPYAHFLQRWPFERHRDAYMLDVVGNTVCADLLDYAKRDSHFSGLRLDYDSDRIAENFTLVSWNAGAYDLERTGHQRSEPKRGQDPFDGWCLRTAISLVSHKFRPDVPGELMNLLNVRFYLYERAIFHPTKCAAGAMLGTALQLLGWRTLPPRLDEAAAPDTPERRGTLPVHLRYVGDEVFLHDIRSASRFVLEFFRRYEAATVVDAAIEEAAKAYDEVHTGVVSQLVKLRVGRTVAEAVAEIEAATLLLNKLAARRFPRLVFRASPNTRDLRLQVGAEGLATTFEKPDVRFAVERRIEVAAGLRLGSVVIHCPRRTTAAKIANVLLVKPGAEADSVCKLRDLASIDPEMFSKHQEAVQAVEQMYRSMWRLAVYLAPEYLDQQKEIAQIIGREIFQQLDIHDHYEDAPDLTWENDLDYESKVTNQAGPRADVDAVGTPQVVVDALNELAAAGRLPPWLDEGHPDYDRADASSRLGALLAQTPNTTPPPPARLPVLIRTVESYFPKALTAKQRRGLDSRYREAVEGLAGDAFDGLIAQLSASIANTPVDLVAHKGRKLSEIVSVVDDLLRAAGAPSPTLGRDDLFGPRK